MKNKTTRCIKLLVALVLWGSPLWAGSKLINVQGKLTDPAGNPLSGSRIITFRLYKTPTGGATTCAASDANCVWMESQSVTLQNGLFNVALGSATALDNVPFNAPYYLGMQVAGDANELQPRQLLGASAYALGSLGDFTVRQNAVVNGNMTVKGRDVATGLLPPGALVPFAGASAPAGFLLCDGSAVSRASYAALFNAIGTAYGPGDGSTTFNVPDLRGRSAFGRAPSGTFQTLGSVGGSETHSHSIAGHTHPISTDGAQNTGDAYHITSEVVSGWVNYPGYDVGGNQYLEEVGDGMAHRHGRHVHSVAGHNHGGATGDSGTLTTTTQSDLNPYIVVNYLIKS